MSDIFKSFQSQLKLVEEATVLRKSDAQALFQDDLKELQRYVLQIENKLKDVERSVEDERRGIMLLDERIEQANKQHLFLRHMEAESMDKIPAVKNVETRVVESNHGAITQDELDSVSPYMKGRLTVERINSALRELSTHAAKNADMIAAVKKNKTSGIDRKHAKWLLHAISRNPSLKDKRYFVLESDLRQGKSLKMDNSSKSILTILRHLGRISECRIQADGQTHVVYACLYL